MQYRVERAQASWSLTVMRPEHNLLSAMLVRPEGLRVLRRMPDTWRE